MEIFSTADAEKFTVVNVFLTLEVNLLVKIFLLLSITLDAAPLSQSSTDVANFFYGQVINNFQGQGTQTSVGCGYISI